MTPLLSHLERAFSLTRDLAQKLDEEYLRQDLPNLPSNTIGEQLWCMIGARESMLKAAQAGQWMGFSCSLQDCTVKAKVLASLESSAHDVVSFVRETPLNESQVSRMMELLEHEVMHHGQLIRLVYGNKLSFPESWNKRYTV